MRIPFFTDNSKHPPIIKIEVVNSGSLIRDIHERRSFSNFRKEKGGINSNNSGHKEKNCRPDLTTLYDANENGTNDCSNPRRHELTLKSPLKTHSSNSSSIILCSAELDANHQNINNINNPSNSNNYVSNKEHHKTLNQKMKKLTTNLGNTLPNLFHGPLNKRRHKSVTKSIDENHFDHEVTEERDESKKGKDDLSPSSKLIGESGGGKLSQTDTSNGTKNYALSKMRWGSLGRDQIKKASKNNHCKESKDDGYERVKNGSVKLINVVSKKGNDKSREPPCDDIGFIDGGDGSSITVGKSHEKEYLVNSGYIVKDGKNYADIKSYRSYKEAKNDHSAGTKYRSLYSNATTINRRDLNHEGRDDEQPKILRAKIVNSPPISTSTRSLISVSPAKEIIRPKISYIVPARINTLTLPDKCSNDTLHNYKDQADYFNNHNKGLYEIDENTNLSPLRRENTLIFKKTNGMADSDDYQNHRVSPQDRSKGRTTNIYLNQNSKPLYFVPLPRTPNLTNGISMNIPIIKDDNLDKDSLTKFNKYDDDFGMMSEVETSNTGYFKRTQDQINNFSRGNIYSHSLDRKGIYNLEKLLSNIIYLRYGSETKRISVPVGGLKYIEDVRTLFARTFPKHLTIRHLTNNCSIYIQDNDNPKDLFYELDEIGDIVNKSVLKIVENKESTNDKDSLDQESEEDYGIQTCKLMPASNNFDKSNRVNDVSYYSEPEHDFRKYRKDNYTGRNYISNSYGSRAGAARLADNKYSSMFASQIVDINGKNNYSCERPLAKQIVLHSNEKLSSSMTAPSKFNKQKQILDHMEAKLKNRNTLTNASIDDSINDLSWENCDTKYKMDNMEKKLNALSNMVQHALVRSSTSDENERLESSSLLKSLHDKTLEIKVDVKSLKHLTKIYTYDSQNFIQQTKNKMLLICKYVPPSAFCKLSNALCSSLNYYDYEGLLVIEDARELVKEIEIYRQDMSKLEKILNDIEISIEEYRNDILQKRSQFQTNDIESISLAMNFANRAVTDLKNRYPKMEHLIIVGIDLSQISYDDKISFNKERQIFLKIEPEKLRNSLNRCKKLTNILDSLKKIVNAEDSTYSRPQIINNRPINRSPPNQSLNSMCDSLKDKVGRSCYSSSSKSNQNINLPPSTKVQHIINVKNFDRYMDEKNNQEKSYYSHCATSSTPLPLLTQPCNYENYDANRYETINYGFKRENKNSDDGSGSSYCNENSTNCYNSSNSSSIISSARSSPHVGKMLNNEDIANKVFNNKNKQDVKIDTCPSGNKVDLLNHKTNPHNRKLGNGDAEIHDMENITNQLEESISHLYEMGGNVYRNSKGRNSSSNQRYDQQEWKFDSMPLDLKDLIHEPYYENLKCVDKTNFPSRHKNSWHPNLSHNKNVDYLSTSYNRSTSSGRLSAMSTRSEPFTNKGDMIDNGYINGINSEVEYVGKGLNDYAFLGSLESNDNQPLPPPRKPKSLTLRSPIMSPVSGNLSPIKEMSPLNSYNNLSVSESNFNGVRYDKDNRINEFHRPQRINSYNDLYKNLDENNKNLRDVQLLRESSDKGSSPNVYCASLRPKTPIKNNEVEEMMATIHNPIIKNPIGKTTITNLQNRINRKYEEKVLDIRPSEDHVSRTYEYVNEQENPKLNHNIAYQSQSCITNTLRDIYDENPSTLNKPTNHNNNKQFKNKNDDAGKQNVEVNKVKNLKPIISYNVYPSKNKNIEISVSKNAPWAPPLPNNSEKGLFKIKENIVTDVALTKQNDLPEIKNVLKKEISLSNTESKSYTMPKKDLKGTYWKEFANIQKQIANEAAQAKQIRSAALKSKVARLANNCQYNTNFNGTLFLANSSIINSQTKSVTESNSNLSLNSDDTKSYDDNMLASNKYLRNNGLQNHFDNFNDMAQSDTELIGRRKSGYQDHTIPNHNVKNDQPSQYDKGYERGTNNLSEFSDNVLEKESKNFGEPTTNTCEVRTNFNSCDQMTESHASSLPYIKGVKMGTMCHDIINNQY
ncbi:unnamed protein product [Gordionus sp. m RMFG-2023]|uniref:protein dopey homolog PFC0245c-like isoform X2 n=1 Tax=Gordionus sp. m RMFG-2023 TaxID=3053472 RepID=UPI0030E3BEF2